MSEQHSSNLPYLSLEMAVRERLLWPLLPISCLCQRTFDLSLSHQCRSKKKQKKKEKKKTRLQFQTVVICNSVPLCHFRASFLVSLLPALSAYYPFRCIVPSHLKPQMNGREGLITSLLYNFEWLYLDTSHFLCKGRHPASHNPMMLPSTDFSLWCWVCICGLGQE